MTDLWKLVADERGVLADDLAALTPEQWNTESWCSGWTVHDVAAHIAATANTTPVGFITGFAKARFNFDAFVNAGIDRERGATPAETVATLRAYQHFTKSPPGPKPSWLGEVLIHAEDIRRPLGILREYPIEASRIVADFYKNSNTLIGAKSRIAGLQLSATDDAWSTGQGPAVAGPLVSLVLAMTGRAGACDDLTGDGVATLRSRCH